MKLNFKDRLKILKTGAAKIEQLASNIEDSLVNYFANTKYLYSRTNIYGQILGVVKDLANLIFFYHDAAVTENNILTAQKEVSVRHFAELSGYQPTRVGSSKGVVRMELMPTFFTKFGTPVYIRRYATLSNTENTVQYLVDIKEDQKIIDSTSNTVYLPVIQGIVKSAKFTADGSKLFTCELSDTDPIEVSHMRIYVDGILWERVDSLLDLTNNQNGYFIKTGFLSQYEIVFGNGSNGNIPLKGSSISIEYFTSFGSAGNLEPNIFPEFTFNSGVFDSSGNSIDVKEQCKIYKDSGFLLGTDGDTVDSLRKVVGYNSRGLILVDSRSFEAYLSKYSFLSKIKVWTEDANRRINHILLLPNLYERLDSAEDYFNVPETEFKLSNDVKENIIQNLVGVEQTYLTTELVWEDPVFLKYSLLIYLEPNVKFTDIRDIYSQIKNEMVDVFVESSFSRMNESQDIAKSVIISKIQDIVGTSCRVSVVIVSQVNEEAKINGYYYTREMQNSKEIEVRKEVPFGTDPFVGLTERNDILCRYIQEIPILRGGFMMLSNTGEQVLLNEPVNLYVMENNDWKKIE